MRPRHNFNAVGHNLARGQGVARTLMCGTDAVAHGDAAKFHRRSARAVDAVFHLLRKLPEIFMSGHNIGK
ncbi:hypothetical protein SDC9_178407 [bioreactor metagenome]|uniref:Uncharacterized protein n=1 Tax=bioreactor metagenome TaxID=1076179 RepID=A0A645GXF2_9ZZZZ